MSDTYDVPKPLFRPGSILDLITQAFAKKPPVSATLPPASPFVDASSPEPPRVFSRQPVAPGAGRDYSVGVPTVPAITAAAPNLLPQAPMLPTPPQMGQPAPFDFNAIKTLLAQRSDTSPAANLLAQRTDVAPYRALLDQMKPDGTATMANVFGGLASGAGSVSAIEPGSFARALAQTGAGGMGGLAKSGTEMREAAGKRAEGELNIAKLGSSERLHEASGLLDIAKLQSGEKGQDIAGNLKLAEVIPEQQMKQNEIAFRNAQTVYETGVKNEITKFQQLTGTRETLMPKVQHDANGITIQKLNPDTGKLEVQFHPTKTILDNAEKMKPLLEALGLPGGAAEAEEAKFVMNSYPDPVLKQEALKNLAVKRTIANGAGGSVFGPLYDTAVKSATKQLQTENPTLVAKPEVYQKELESRIASIIMSDPRIHNLDWTRYAAPHSVAARLIAEGLSRKEVKPGTE